MQSKYIMKNAGLDEAQAGIKIVRRNVNNLRYADDTTLMAEREEELKSLLMKLKEENEKVWKESYDRSRQHIQKQRHYFANKVHLVKAMVFPVVMYGCESWTVKRPEHQRIDAFELWCWRRLLRVPWTARRSNQSILKEISPGCSLEGLKLKLKCQYFGHLMRRADSFEKTLMLGKIGGRRRRG